MNTTGRTVSTARGFTMVPNALLRHEALAARTKLIAMALLSYAFGDARIVEVSQSRIAADLRIARSTVNEEFRALVDAGLIKTESRIDKSLRCDVSGLRDLSSAATGTCSQPRQARVASDDTNNTGAKTARTRASGTPARKNTRTAKSHPTSTIDPDLSPEPYGSIHLTSSASGSPLPVVSAAANSNARDADDGLRINTYTKDANTVTSVPARERKAEAKHLAGLIYNGRMREDGVPPALRDLVLDELSALHIATF